MHLCYLHRIRYENNVKGESFTRFGKGMVIKMKKGKAIAKDILLDVLGGLFIGIGVYNFALFAEFPMTGFSGLSILLYRLFGITIGVSTVILNIPVAILCYRLLGKVFFLRSIKSMLISSFIIDTVAPLLPVYRGDRLLAAICTGVFAGIGYAIIYSNDSSTGGADFIIMSLKAWNPHISLGKIAFVTDVIIILLGTIVFPDMDGLIYGMIVSYLLSVVVDKWLYGVDAGKLALVVTHHGEMVADVIEGTCQRGSTLLQGVGAYSKDKKQVVMCACNNKQMHLIQKAVKEADQESFMIILESNEVLGEGFKEFLEK